jgi:ribosomal RNA-processing protein 12
VCLAVCTVLGLTLPRVPNATLRLKFVGCSAIIIGLLDRHRGDAQLCRAALLCLAQLLAALDPGHWPSAAAPWGALLSFVLDNRPKVTRGRA